MADLAGQIEALWEGRDQLAGDDEAARALVHEAIDLLDRGEVRVAEVVGRPGRRPRVAQAGHPPALPALADGDGRARAVRVRRQDPAQAGLPGRRRAGRAGGQSPAGAPILEPGVIMMPSYVNIGARVGAGTMVDTWATVGSCAQIGRNVHLSGGVGHRRRARAAQRGAGDGGRRVPDRQPVHRRRRRPGRRRRRPRGRVHPHRVDPRHRVLERQRGRAGCGATVDRRGRRQPVPHVPRRARVRVAVRAAHQAARRGSSATTRARSTTCCATTAPPCDGSGTAHGRGGDLVTTAAEPVTAGASW